MASPSNAQEMISYIQEKVLRRSDVEIAVDTPLVSSGLIDSFALVNVLLRLEKVTKRRIPAGKISPLDMDTVQRMLQTAERVGTPRA